MDEKVSESLLLCERTWKLGGGGRSVQVGLITLGTITHYSAFIHGRTLHASFPSEAIAVFVLSHV